MLYPLIEFFLLHQSSATKYTLIGMPFLYQQLPIPPLRSRFTIFCASLRSFKRCSPPIPVTRPYRKLRHMKKTPTFVSVFSFISSFLSSRAASGQVLSAFVSLTSVFGMDTGDPHSYRHCFSESLFSQNHIEEVLKLFACLGVSKLRPRPISFMSLQALRLFHS